MKTTVLAIRGSICDRTLFSALLGMRIRWYGVCTGRLVRRHWQWIVLSLAFLPMGLSLAQVLAVFGYPFIVVLDTSTSAVLRFGILMLICLLAVAWVYVQRTQIMAAEFTPYFRALPLPPKVVAAADLLVLSLATSVILLPSFAAMFADKQLIPMPMGRRIVSLLVAVCVILLVEFAVLRQRWRLVATVVLANILLAIGLGYADALACVVTLILVLATLAVAVWLEFIFPSNRMNIDAASAKGRVRPVLRSNTWSLWQLPWRALWEHASVSVPRVVLASAIAAAAIGVQSAFLYDSRAKNSSVVLLAIVALVLSGLFRVLNDTHATSRLYLRALPISQAYLTWLDISCLVTLGSAVFSMVFVRLLQHGLVSIGSAAAIFLSLLLLLALLRLPIMRAGRHAVLVAILMAATWSSLILALLG